MTADPAFLERTRARRAAAGRPDKIQADSVYRILDGLLAPSADRERRK